MCLQLTTLSPIVTARSFSMFAFHCVRMRSLMFCVFFIGGAEKKNDVLEMLRLDWGNLLGRKRKLSDPLAGAIF